MDEHFTDPEISMTAIAESIDLSTARFSLSFKERMGMTPLDLPDPAAQRGPRSCWSRRT